MFDNFFERFVIAFLTNKGYQLMLSGLFNTLLIAFGALLLGIVLGIITAIIKVMPKKGIVSKILNIFASIYITVIRGTPIMVQLLLVYFGIVSSLNILSNFLIEYNPLGVRIQINVAVLCAMTVMGINSGAYVAEIVRSGIQSVDRGQMEAGRSLGLSYGMAMKKIVLPQAIKNILPALGNELIILIKETSVVGFITVLDLTRAASSIVSKTYDAFVPYLVLAVVYLVIVMIASSFVRLLERVMGKSDSH